MFDKSYAHLSLQHASAWYAMDDKKNMSIVALMDITYSLLDSLPTIEKICECLFMILDVYFNIIMDKPLLWLP